MTQLEVARRFNVDRGTVYRWECGDSRIDLQVLIDAAAMFGCEKEWLVFGEGQAPHVPSEWDKPATSDDGQPCSDEPRVGEGAP